MPNSADKKKSVLILTYAFPPAGGGGVQRPTKFVKYLPQFGWQPVVLTATEDSLVQTDESLLRDVPDGIDIERVKPWLSQKRTHKIRNRTGAVLPAERKQKQKSLLGNVAGWLRTWFLIPDSQIFWVIPAAFKLRKVIRKYQPDIIFATAPPYSVLLLGLLAKRLAKKPLVSDFRDPWSQYFVSLRKTEIPFRKKLESVLERRVVQKSEAVISPTKDMTAFFQRTYPHENADKFKLIYNGFDEDDFRGIQPKKFDRFTIVYTGKVVSDLYSAVPFLKAYLRLLKQNPGIAEKIVVRFVGIFEDKEAMTIIRNYNLHKNIRIEGYLPHRECISYQLGADILLLIQNPELKESLTGKVFEYLYTKKPILAVIPTQSPAIEVLDQSGVATVVSPVQTNKIADELQRSFESRDSNINGTSEINMFSRRTQTKSLASLLDSLCASLNSAGEPGKSVIEHPTVQPQ